MVWSEKLLSVKAVPNQSTLEGGGTVALVFYQQLPVGGKFICFMSRSNPNNAVTKQAYEENALVLTTDIPKHTVAEVVDLFVYGSNGQLLASTLFTYYDAMQSHSSDMILQILQQQLHNYFPTQGAMGASAVGGQTGSGAGYSSGYSVPNTAYQLLLGACRLGCEPLVNIILALPLMAAITSDELQKACEIAQNCGHTNLYEVLQQMVIMAGIPQAQMISRDPTGSGNEEKKGHVEEYYTAMNKLSNGGITPEERASTVMKHLLAAIKESAQSVPTVAVVPSEEEEEPSKSAGAVEELTTQLEATSITPKTRRHSHLQHQQSISDEDDPSADVPHSDHSRVSLSEQSDTVAPLPRDDIHTKRKQTFAQAQAQSETDSAIGMSFEDESMLGEVQFRKNSGFTTIDFARDSSVKTITVKLPPDAGTEVANSLAWKTTFVVTEDFPPSSERKIFHRGDHILQIGSKLVTGMSREEFAELFDKEASAGTSMTVLPNLHSDSKEHKMLRRTPSDQTILDTIGKRVNQLFTMRSSSNVRHVSIPHMSTGFGVKMIGGKSVGVFISDVMSDVKTVATGDQVLAINGHTTQGLTLHKATKLLRLSSSDLKLSVVENKARFQSVRERFELDSFYMRSRIDMPSTSVKDMSVKKGMLLHVVNTFMHAPNHWLAWAVDEDTAMETQLRRIPSPAMAKKTYKTDAYDSVERQSEAVHRPVCIVGPDSKHVAEGLATRPQFKLCSTLVETLTVFAQGTHQPVFSSTDGTELEQMKNLNPILLQTRATVTAPLANQIACSKLNVSGYLFGENPSDLVNHAAQQVEDHLYRPTWRTVEACC